MSAACHSRLDVDIYRTGEIKHRLDLDRTGLVLIALLAGGDYDATGVPGMSASSASQLAKAGYGDHLGALITSPSDVSIWKERLVEELKHNGQGLFSTRLPSISSKLRLSPDFPRLDILDLYLHPATTPPSDAVVDFGKRISPLDISTFCSTTLHWSADITQERLRKLVLRPLVIQQLRFAALGRDLPDRSFPLLDTNFGFILKFGTSKLASSTDNILSCRVDLDAKLLEHLVGIAGQEVTGKKAINKKKGEKEGATSVLRIWVPHTLLAAAFGSDFKNFRCVFICSSHACCARC